MKLLIILCSLLLSGVRSQEVKEQFEKNEMVPDVINKAPEELIVVNFPKTFAKLGNELTPTEVKTQPEVQWEASPSSYYTLVMVDPDGFSRQNATLRNVLHWLVVNIPGSNVLNGEIKAHFIPSGPPRNSGLHRYVFLTYEQGEKKEFDEPEIPSDVVEARFHFSVKDFEKKYGFDSPKGGNFYMAQWDESVTTK